MQGAELFSLSGKVALVTGGGRGIGNGIAKGLAQVGAHIAVASRDMEVCEQAAEELRSYGVQSRAFKVDVSARSDVQALVGSVIDTFGGIDILVNNAGIFKRTPLVETPEDDWLEVMEINLNGAYFCSKVVADHMIQRGQGGKIINVTSLNAFRAGSEVSAYCASKGGMQMFTKALAVELAPHKINVNAIAPGLTETDIHRKWMADPEAREKAARKIPWREIMQPEEFAGVAIFLSSPASRMITGQTVVVDGGWTTPL